MSTWTERLDDAVQRSGPSERFSDIRALIDSSEMPDSSMEEWRYSGIDDLDIARYSVGPVGAVVSDRGSLVAAPIFQANSEALVIKTRNGLIDPDFVAPKGITLETSDSEDISHDFSGADLFSYLNVLMSDPVVLSIDGTYDAERPVIVAHYLDCGEATALFPNLCLRTEPGAFAKVIEVFVSPSDAQILAIPVTKLFVEERSELDYLLIQDLGTSSNMIGHQVSRVMAGAKLRSTSIVAGGSYARLFTTSTVAGAGAQSNLNAAYFGSGEQVLDFRTLQEHSAPNCRSELYFKGAAANSSHLVYSGLIKVDKGATSTDAFQTNKNLVLSEGARADSVPNLDIQENDVRCSHASSVGPIDEDQQYYLESRGIRPELVKRLIVGGFFSEMADRSSITGVKETLMALSQRKWEEFQQ